MVCFAILCLAAVLKMLIEKVTSKHAIPRARNFTLSPQNHLKLNVLRDFNTELYIFEIYILRGKNKYYTVYNN